MMKKTELLAPAGDMETLKTALRFGADAVYIGGPFMQLRAQTSGFGIEEIVRAAEYTHSLSKKLYVTVNSFAKNREIEPLKSYAKELYGANVDGVIVSDIGALSAVRKAAPDLPVHISTQANCQNYASALVYYEMGARRVVTGREMTLSEICEMKQKLPFDMEIECFVHGAMCMSYSGRCFLSPYLSHRSGNRGECTQPCRWSYHLVEEKRPGEFFPVLEEEDGTYILNAKDLCMIEYLDQLVEAGVSSFKIEGRAKSFYYVATITNAYRCAVDLLKKDPAHYRLPGWLLEETKKVSHRQYCTGFYFGRPENGQYYESGGYIRDYDVAAVVQGWSDNMLFCTQRNRFFPGDILEVLSPGLPPENLTVSAIFDEKGQSLDAARHPMQLLRIPCEKMIAKGTILRRQQKGRTT